MIDSAWFIVPFLAAGLLSMVVAVVIVFIQEQRDLENWQEDFSEEGLDSNGSEDI